MHRLVEIHYMIGLENEAKLYAKVLGYNYRLTDMQAALGISQLKRLDKFISRRKEIARFYLDNLKEMVLPFQHHDTNSSWHLFVIQTENRKKVYEDLIKKGIQTQVHYIPIIDQPYYKKNVNVKGPFENVKKYYKQTLSLPMYPLMSDGQVMRVIQAVGALYT